MCDLPLRDGLSVVCFTRQGASSPFFAIREFDTKILRLPTGREGGNLRVQGVSEQAIRARITQVMMKLQLVPFKGLKSEVKILKQRGILGKRAPKCSLLKGPDMINLLRAFGKDSFANDLEKALQDFKKKPRTLKPRSAFSALREKQGTTPENNRTGMRRVESKVKRSLKFQPQPPMKRKKLSLPHGTELSGKVSDGSFLSQSSTTSQNQTQVPPSDASGKILPLPRPLPTPSSPPPLHKKQSVDSLDICSTATQKLPYENELQRETRVFPVEQNSEKSLNCAPDPMASQNLIQASVSDVPSLSTKPTLARIKSYDSDAPPLLQRLTRTRRTRTRSQIIWTHKPSAPPTGAWGSETLGNGCTTTRFPTARTSEETSLAGTPAVYPFKSSFSTRADANTWNEINRPKPLSQENSGIVSDNGLSRTSPPSTFNFDLSALSKMMFVSTPSSKINFDLSALDSFIESLPDSPGHPSVTISTETLTDYDQTTTAFSDMSGDSAYWRTCQGLPSLLPSLY